MAFSIDGPSLLRSWERLSTWPLGKHLFSRLIFLAVPYSGSIGARIEELRPGYARVLLRDRRRVRNHLRSIHAVALANLGELSSGLSLITNLPRDARAIAVGLSIDFRKKARGTLSAEGTCGALSLPAENQGDTEHQVKSIIRDDTGATVAETRVDWRIGVQRKDLRR